MQTEYKLPCECENILQQFRTEPQELQEMRRYGMVAMLIAEGTLKSPIGRWNGESLQLTVMTENEETFPLVRPPISMEAEAALMTQMRKLVAGTTHNGNHGG